MGKYWFHLNLLTDSLENLKRANMLNNSETRIFIPAYLSKTVNGKKWEDYEGDIDANNLS